MEQTIPEVTTSPKGRKCVGMTIDEQQWLLFVVRGPRMAGRLGVALGPPTIFGPPVDWRSSVKTGEIVMVDIPNAVGVYVQAERFDELIDLYRGL